MAKGPHAFRTISEAADELGVPQHVLRFWESRFSFIRPMKRAGGRRFYRPQDIAVLAGVRALLHGEGYTIKGVQKLHKDFGVARILAAQDGPLGAAPIDYATDHHDDDETLPPDIDVADIEAEIHEPEEIEAAIEAIGESADDDVVQPAAYPLDLTPPPARTRPAGLTPDARLRLTRALSDLTAVQDRLDALLRGESTED